jgi:hypothetical protein
VEVPRPLLDHRLQELCQIHRGPSFGR